LNLGAAAVLLTAILAGATAAQDTPRAAGRRHLTVPETMDAITARSSLDRGVAFLVRTQNENGSWATGAIEGLLDSGYSVASFYDWQYGAQALACQALLRVDQTPARRQALEKGLRWLTITRLPKRGSDWDNDTVWAALYGTITAIEALGDPQFSKQPWRRRLERRGKELLQNLLRNQVPTGGWAYYDDPPYTRRPKWATSFCTALILPTLVSARKMKWFDDDRVIERARAHVRRCRLPNGAYEYDLNPIPRAPAGDHINQVKGSLGRIQVCQWGLRASGDASITDARIRVGLERLFQHHRFLDIARMRPVPHEAYYANAGYFYFFAHHYAAEAITLLPEEERARWHQKLRPHLVKTQRRDGSFCDFLGQSYLLVADTAFAVLALQRGLP